MGKKEIDPRADAMEEDDSSDSDSSSGSDIGMSDDEDGGEEVIAQLQKTLAGCGGYDYDAHADLVRALSRRAKMKDLGKAREAFSAAFALHDDVWLEWIADEARVALSDKDRASVVALYERALADFPVVPIWESYNEFLIAPLRSLDAGDAALSAGVEQARAVAERAVAAMGAHVAEGHRLWTQLVDLELLALAAAPEPARARDAFLRQLAAPATGDATAAALERFREWESDAAQVAKGEAAAAAAAAAAAERTEAEARVAPGGDEDVLAAWEDYLALETRLKRSDRVRPRNDRRVDPDDVTLGVYEGTARVAGVERHVRLDDPFDHAAVLGA